MAIAIPAPKIAFMAMPKAACFSVKQALASLDPDVPGPSTADADFNRPHVLYPTRRFRAHRWAAYADLFRFRFVRDPVERLMAVYTNRVVARTDLANSPCPNIGVPVWPDLPIDPGPATFVVNLRAYRALSSSITHHSFGARHFIGRDLGADRNDRIHRTRELNAMAWDLSLLSRQTARIPRINWSDQRLTLDDRSDRSIDAIRRFLDGDYRHLAGFYDNPLGARLYGTCTMATPRVS